MISHGMLNETEKNVLALWACQQSIKQTAKCLFATPHQITYARCILSSKFGVASIDEMPERIKELKDYDAWVLMGQNLMVMYEHQRIHRRLAAAQKG